MATQAIDLGTLNHPNLHESAKAYLVAVGA